MPDAPLEAVLDEPPMVPPYRTMRIRQFSLSKEFNQNVGRMGWYLRTFYDFLASGFCRTARPQRQLTSSVRMATACRFRSVFEVATLPF
jgi:hypothetical protein